MITQLETMTAEQLNRFLAHFYAKSRSRDGKMYARKSLQSMRYGLQQHFKKTSNFDIISDPQFRSSSEMFAHVLAEAKKADVGFVTVRVPLTPDDFRKLYWSDVLNTSNPTGLQNKVFVDVMVHLCRHVKRNLREMTRNYFQSASDSVGKCFVFIAEKQTTNHSCNTGVGRMRRMYETPGLPTCPVASLEKYISKLNANCSAFWQIPNKEFVKTDPCWYYNIPVGKTTLCSKMKCLSEAAGLSKKYTNNNLLATCIMSSND